MTATVDPLLPYLQAFAAEADNFLDVDYQTKADTIRSLLSEKALEELSVDDLERLASNLWAHRRWTKKREPAERMASDGVDYTAEVLKDALYRIDEYPAKFERLQDINQTGEAAASEILMFFYPEYCPVVNTRSKDALAKLGYADQVPDSISNAEEYSSYIDALSDIQSEIRETARREKLDVSMENFIDLDSFFYFIDEAGEEIERFQPGAQYNRRDLHDQYGGNRQAGIAPSADYPLIFCFVSPRGDQHGYQDEFLPDGTLKYTGEGTEGDMEFERGNQAIRDHHEEENELHVFYRLDDGAVQYVGEYAYADHEWVQLEDTHGESRAGIRFTLAPMNNVALPSPHRANAVFMARGYKDDPFHRHVARSLANYFSEDKITELRKIVESVDDYDGSGLLNLLESETVTAWGAKSGKRSDRSLFDQMSDGDLFVMRTGQPTVVEFVQRVDCKLGEDVPREVREALSEAIWTGPDYDLLWFSQTPVLELSLREQDFEDIVTEALPDFEMSDWFPSQGQNFTRVDDTVISEYGGPTGFIAELKQDRDTYRSTETTNYFLLDARSSDKDPSTDRFFDFEKKGTDLADEVLDAENDGRVLIHDGAEIYATGRIGNVEGSRRDGSLYKSIYILDYQEIDPIDLEALEEVTTPDSGETTIDTFVTPVGEHIAAVEQLRAEVYTDLISYDSSAGCMTVSSEPAPYYWVNQADDKDPVGGDFLRVPEDDVWYRDLAKLESDDIVFNYSDGEIIGYSVVQDTVSTERENGDQYCRVPVEFTPFEPPISFREVFDFLLQDDVRLEDYYPVNESGVNQHYLYNLSQKAGDYLFEKAEAKRSAAEQRERLASRLSLPTVSVDLPDDLYFHGGESERLQQQINAALNSGKHIIFTGPPGTGKSKLAKHVAEQISGFDAIDDYTFTTATAEWTTFDTIGGYVPDPEEDRLTFDPRLFLRCFRTREGQIHNQWLVIDELNRANIDKALGPLFSVLSQDSVELPYERDERVTIEWIDEVDSSPEMDALVTSRDRYPVTPAWRILGTMNTFDKTSLYELSFAFMRRFSFIHVGVPELREDGVAMPELLDPSRDRNYATVWLEAFPELGDTIEEYHKEMTVLWAVLNEHRSIGPSIVLDMFQHIDAYQSDNRADPFTSAVISLIFPQLEGMRRGDQRELIEDIADGGEVYTADDGAIPVDLPLKEDYLWQKAEDMFEL